MKVPLKRRFIRTRHHGPFSRWLGHNGEQIRYSRRLTWVALMGGDPKHEYRLHILRQYTIKFSRSVIFGYIVLRLFPFFIYEQKA